MADDPTQHPAQRLSRRKLLGLAGAAGGAAVIGAGGYVALRSDDEAAAGPGRSEPFYGDHQSGVATESPKYLHFAAFDVHTGDRAGLQRLLRELSAAAAEATAGGSHGIDDPGRLTITFGLGPSLFDDRYGLAMQRPAPLADIPPFAHDRLDPAISNGDLAVQFCSDDRAVTLHAAVAIAAAARGAAGIRWSQDGFTRDKLRGDTSPNRRNLFGFLDGSNNLHGDDAAQMRSHVWADDASPAWMQNGTYMVTRKILMQMDEFLIESVDLQQDTFGRNKGTGAPLGEQHENDPVDPSKVLPDCHIMMANQRRSYSEQRADPAPRLQLHRRLRRPAQQPAGRPLLHRLPAGSAPPVHPHPDSGCHTATGSPSTSSTARARSGRCLPAPPAAATWAKRCSRQPRFRCQIRRRPSSVSHGSTRSMVWQWGTTTPASPPVASVATVPPSSAANRRTSPSTSPA